MKNQKLEFKIPTLYLLLLVLFLLITNFIIETNSQGQTEIYKIIYRIGFIMTNSAFSYLSGFLLLLPFPLLIFASVKKRKEQIIGFSIAATISIVLLILLSL